MSVLVSSVSVLVAALRRADPPSKEPYRLSIKSIEQEEEERIN
jgi:hypothetical protein